MRRPRVPVALTIAGSDSGGGAGIQADLKTFEALGVWGTCALTGVTAQNTLGVLDSLVLPPPLVRAQIEAVCDDIGVSAAKTGMLGTAEVIVTVAQAAVDHRFPWLVVDPVLVTSHGELLLEEGAVKVLLEELVPLCSVVTPNIPEAEALLGHPIDGREGMAAAAEELAAAGAPAVLLKGGHLRSDESPDVLYSEGRIQWLSGSRVESRHTHGTGCTLSAAICAELATGASLHDSCVRAKEFVTESIRAGVDVGSGVGPVNPGWGRGGSVA
ncbi:MAG TPA: bifunctional hydroxymethylpyrimidine kinase/phosphomethylpyrimidine kinase [Acidimicrobiales bacterium]|nr:bifunctional hydroxymethylpyrimidine kinase/phosphomethylpyrimidine kinase [Acidimicrobiales bacterium]